MLTVVYSPGQKHPSFSLLAVDGGMFAMLH